MQTRSNRLSPNRNPNLKKEGWVNEVCNDKHQITEEPYEAKVSRTVLEARQGSDTLSLASGFRTPGFL